MESNNGEDVMISGSNEATCPEATVEIKIKTLDSQTYTLRVDKCVPVPALKEQIATVTGVLSEQQRLICRGKVLKDDQLLSAYHVEDGHTLHLVVRQPILPSSESFPDHPATDPVSGTGHGEFNQAGPSVLVGSFNISEQGDGVFPDLSRIVSAVLGSFGLTDGRSGGEEADLQAPASERLSRTSGLVGLRNSSGQQPGQAATRGQSNPHHVAFPLPTAVTLESLQPQVIPDSLTTLSQYLSRMRRELSSDVTGESSTSSQAAGAYGSDGHDSFAASGSATGQGGLPTPASLAEVMLSTRQMFNEQVGECLLQLMRQLEDHANVTDPVARMRIQSNAMRTGALLQNLGALLLELGRTTMTVRMGQTPADAVVNAGPAVFLSTSGPNPIMVQPLPFQPGTSFGAIPLETVQPVPGLSSGSAGSGFLPRNIDIRIRTGSLMHSAIGNPREPTGPQGQTDPAASSTGNAINQGTAGASGNSSAARESEVRVVPVRTVVTAIPAPVGRAPSDSSRGSMGSFYPVLARVQHVNSGNANSIRGQAANEHGPHGVNTGQQAVPNTPVQQQNVDVPRADGATRSSAGIQHGQVSSAEFHSGLDQLLRTIFPGEQIHGNDVNFQGIGTSFVTGHVGTTQNAVNSQEAASRVGDEGIFLSNLLHQIMPIISQNTNGSNNSSEGGDVIEDRTTQNSSAQENPDRGTSSRREGNPPHPSSSKRQKRE